MTQAEAELLAVSLFAHYPAFRATEHNIQAFTLALKGMSLDVGRAAIIRVTRAGSKFPPSVPELLSACVVNARGDRKTGEEAYVELMQMVRRYGRVYTRGGSGPPFADPLIAKCIGVWGSWNDVCNAPDNDPGGRARFIELYNSLAAQGDQHAVLPAGLIKERPKGLQQVNVPALAGGRKSA